MKSMGMYDSLQGYVSCPYCNKVQEEELQVKWGDRLLQNYHIGDVIRDSVKTFEVIDEDRAICNACDKRFMYYAIGYKGKLYGFSNEKELKNIQALIPLKETEDVETISIVIPKNLRKENPQLFLEQVMEHLQSNMEEDKYYVAAAESTEEKEVVNQNICRISKKSRYPFSPLQVQDTCWYYPSKLSQEPWEEADVQYVITEQRLQEEENVFYYTIQNENGNVISNVPDYYLVDKERKPKILKALKILENDILKYVEYTLNDKKEELPFPQRLLFFSFNAPLDYVEYLKKQGKIPKDFTI